MLIIKMKSDDDESKSCTILDKLMKVRREKEREEARELDIQAFLLGVYNNFFYLAM